jgi:hypothetical protein
MRHLKDNSVIFSGGKYNTDSKIYPYSEIIII